MSHIKFFLNPVLNQKSFSTVQLLMKILLDTCIVFLVQNYAISNVGNKYTRH